MGIYYLFILSIRTMGKRVIPENILKKQARDAKLLKARQDGRKAAKTARGKARKEQYTQAEKYFNEYQAADAALVKARRDAKANGSFFVEAQPKVAFIIRIKGINKLAPKPKKILQLLRLSHSLPSDTHQEKPSASSSTRGAMVRSTEAESHSLTTASSPVPLAPRTKTET